MPWQCMEIRTGALVGEPMHRHSCRQSRRDPERSVRGGRSDELATSSGRPAKRGAARAGRGRGDGSDRYEATP